MKKELNPNDMLAFYTVIDSIINTMNDDIIANNEYKLAMEDHRECLLKFGIENPQLFIQQLIPVAIKMKHI